MNIFYDVLLLSLFVLTLLGEVAVAVDYYNSSEVNFINPDSASNAMSWLDAQTYCRYLDSTLAILDTPTAIQSFHNALTYFGLNSTDTWIGANATYVAGNWKWLNGANYTGPAVQGVADFIHSYATISKQQTAITVSATSAIYVFNYLCQYPATSCVSGSRPTLFTSNGFCYVVSNDLTTWFTARNNCLTNGGDLAVLQDFNSISQYLNGTQYWIGLRGSLWKWQNAVTGTTSDLTFSFWANSQPNDNSADCMSIRSSSASDNACNVPLRFVCQKGVPSTSTSTSTIRVPATSPTTLRSSTSTSTSRSSTPTSTSTSTTHSLNSPKYIPTALSSVMSSVETSSRDPNSTNVTSTHSSLAMAIGIAVGVGVPVIAIIIAVIAVIAYRCGRKKRNADERNARDQWNARDQGANVPENSPTYLELEKSSRVIKANEYAKLELPLDKLKEQEVTTDKPYMNLSELSEYANHSEIA